MCSSKTDERLCPAGTDASDDDDDDDDDAYSYYTSDGEADSLGGVVEGDAPSLPHRNGQQSSMADLLAASLTRVSVESDDVDADAGPTAHRRRRRRHSSQDASGTPLVETRSMLLAKAQERERRRLARRAAAAAATRDASEPTSEESGTAGVPDFARLANQEATSAVSISTAAAIVVVSMGVGWTLWTAIASRMYCEMGVVVSGPLLWSITGLGDEAAELTVVVGSLRSAPMAPADGCVEP